MDWRRILDDCEAWELQDGRSNAPGNYSKMLLAFLALGDTNNARFCWQRIASAAAATPELNSAFLKSVWVLVEALWKQDLSKFFVAARSTQWPPDFQPFVSHLIDSKTKHSLHLISKAYSTVRLEQCAKLLGMDKSSVATELQKLGWAVEGDNVMPAPLREDLGEKEDQPTIKQLDQLAHYVVHLEEKHLSEIKVDPAALIDTQEEKNNGNRSK
eukprot:CAMPEP_0175088222 /NCGR_PEP_ID=MMETSP0086_2-20121207/137_1 /TAXON_ID=136419 /ORGANISM="Unknown Unknown, Strain D1" /LENGTH=213 /DNA_ID=CAMNT_0016360649 /DNA_START=8 /DNA_END=649 /DNA_ORIENTATION=+